MAVLIALLAIGASLCNFLDFEDLVASGPERVAPTCTSDDDSLCVKAALSDAPPDPAPLPTLLAPPAPAPAPGAGLRGVAFAPRPDAPGPQRAPQVTRRGPPHLLPA